MNPRRGLLLLGLLLLSLLPLAAQAAGGGTAGLLYCVEVSICASLKANHA